MLRILLVTALAAPAVAADALPPNAKVTKLAVSPAAVDLTGPFAYAQLLVTATLDTGETMDVTRLAKAEATVSVVPPRGPKWLWTAGKPAPAAAKVSAAGQVRPLADGKTTLAVSLAGQSVNVPVTVTGFAANKPISFVTDIQPVLSKLGCNQGTCHGAAAGKNGFKLSLRGYDPLYDHRALTDDLEARRFNRAAPDRSLMLLKPAGAVAHAGGVLWQPGDPNYEMVRQWITEGVTLDLTAVRVKSIEVSPAVVTIPAAGRTQQFTVIATYADGRKRDVSAEAFIESSNTDVATVDRAGVLTTARRGEATLLARYEGAYAAAGVVVMGDRTGFEWKPQPVQNFVDELVDNKLKKMKIQASDLCTDEEFLRRVHIDLTGLPPSADEVRAFLADGRPSKEKRDAVIDRLVGGDAYIDHWTNKWADLLQVNRKFLGDRGATALRGWIRDAIADNLPYDRFAYQVLTASGSNVTNPPAAYYKVLRQADEVMENTTQLFLAVRFNCNKCHDHPFEKWTQDQYYETAAFFSQVSRTEDPNFKGQTIGRTDVEKAKPLVEVIKDATAGEMTHERTGAVAPPKFPYPLLGTGDPAESLPRRVRLAKWATAAENPYFAKSYVNRIWSYLTGVGIIEPVDDIRAGNPPTNPELLDKLTQEFIDSGFNTRKLIRTICKSRTYQLSFAANKWNKDDEINYSRALPRRLSAEALFDSIHKVTGAVSKLPGLPPGSRAAQLVDGTVDLPGGFLELFGKPVRESACECERSNTMMLGPVLAMVNGPIVGDAIRDPANRISKLVEAEKDDAKVVEEIYLSVLNRRPTAKEIETGIAAVRGATKDLELLKAEYTKKKTAFDEYDRSIAGKLKPFEATLAGQKPTRWTTLAPAVATATAATLTALDDGAVLASGKADKSDDYKLTTRLRFDGKVTALRLEALTDPSLPGNGPGRNTQGNFVLNELTVTARPANGGPAVPVKLIRPQATFSQNQYPVANAIDGKPDTGWGIAPQVGKNQAAIFQLAQPLSAAGGVVLEVTLTHRFTGPFGLGKFRLSYTTERGPKLTAPITLELADILETPDAERTPAQVAKVREAYIAQDGEYQRLLRDIPQMPPADARVMGAQDLTWALINTPAFLFNR